MCCIQQQSCILNNSRGSGVRQRYHLFNTGKENSMANLLIALRSRINFDAFSPDFGIRFRKQFLFNNTEDRGA